MRPGDGHWGVATQSKFLAVGSVVPWAEPHVGAIATQSYANPSYGPDGLRCSGTGSRPGHGRAADRGGRGARPAPARRRRRPGRRGDLHRPGCHDWAGGRTGDCYAAQGNILVSGATVDALAETFEATAGTARRAPPRLPRRGPGRGRRQARPAVGGAPGRRDATAGYAGLSDTLVDLRVDDHPRPLEELRRLYGLHDALFGRTPRDEWLDIDDELAAELRERLAGSATTGNWPARWGVGPATRTWRSGSTAVERIDPVVLEQLREANE